METLKAILTRRSIREYTQQAVPGELVQELLAAAMQAPSAGNQQPWHFILVNAREQLQALADVLPFGKSLQTAPLGIAVCADVKSARYPDYWAQDCSAATQNLLLAAHALGLGAVWLGVYPLLERYNALIHHQPAAGGGAQVLVVTRHAAPFLAEAPAVPLPDG